MHSNRPHFNSNRRNDRQKVNQALRYQYNEVKVIDENDVMLGIMSSNEALLLAQQRGLDLVEISSNVNPPVCKILDYGKHKYKVQKQANQSKKAQKPSILKEIKLHVNIGSGDYAIKLKKAIELLEEGFKIKVSLKLRGREMMHKGIAIDLLNKLIQDLEPSAKVEKDIAQSNNQFNIIIAPNIKGSTSK